VGVAVGLVPHCGTNIPTVKPIFPCKNGKLSRTMIAPNGIPKSVLKITIGKSILKQSTYMFLWFVVLLA
jgi:hypothetical protein